MTQPLLKQKDPIAFFNEHKEADKGLMKFAERLVELRSIYNMSTQQFDEILNPILDSEPFKRVVDSTSILNRRRQAFAVLDYVVKSAEVELFKRDFVEERALMDNAKQDKKQEQKEALSQAETKTKVCCA